MGVLAIALTFSMAVVAQEALMQPPQPTSYSSMTIL
jgi:hypothetical protein